MNARHAVIEIEPLGALTLVASGTALVGVYFPGHWTLPDPTTFGSEVDAEGDRVLSAAAAELREYLEGERTSFDTPTAACGTAFEERVWEQLRAIPYGETATYGDLAEMFGSRSRARLVGRAVGRNPLSVIVGCHRVVGASGELRGYAGGLERKRFLLDHEQGVAALASKAR